MKGFDYFENFMRNEGYRYEDSENFIKFKYQGTTFFAFKNDSSFLQVLVPCSVKGIDELKVLRCCNQMNDDKFVVKFVYKGDGSVWCNYEIEPNESTTTADFEFIFRALDSFSDEFLKMVNA